MAILCDSASELSNYARFVLTDAKFVAHRREPQRQAWTLPFGACLHMLVMADDAFRGINRGCGHTCEWRF